MARSRGLERYATCHGRSPTAPDPSRSATSGCPTAATDGRPWPPPCAPGPERGGALWRPARGDGRPPVAALWQGGGYVPEVDRTIMGGVAEDLCRRGWAVWNLEYRRVGSGGGWPQTFADAAD